MTAHVRKADFGKMTNDLHASSRGWAAFANNLEFADFASEFANLIDAVGSRNFYDLAAHCLGNVMGCSRQLVLKYGQYSRPEFLVNRSLPGDMLTIYYEKLYRIDPLMKMVRSQVEQPIMTFIELKKTASDTYFYDESFYSHQIYDELVWMLEAMGGIWIAICVDRDDGAFLSQEIAAARHLYPMFEKLHRLHVSESLFNDSNAFLADSKMAIMILDAEKNVISRSNRWKQAGADATSSVLKQAQASLAGAFAITPSLIGHWRPLDGSHAFAPGGTIIVLEEKSPGYIDVAGNSWMKQFSDIFSLTPREQEIVAFTLEGSPSSRIAKALDVSVGTIRNHKHRIYTKLDITSERELFVSFFRVMLEAPARSSNDE